jgi:hypothetical protein
MIETKHINTIKQEFDGKFVGDARHKFAVGDVGFLLELTPPNGQSRIELRDSPARTAFTLTDVLYGWIDGKTTVEALGAAKVTEVARNGRGKVVTLWGPELDAALNDLGYPDISRENYVEASDL